jgi:hypothetical protein
MSERRAIRVIGADRSAVRYRSTRPDDTALRDRLKSLALALALERRRFGYRRLHVLLHRDGHVVNHTLAGSAASPPGALRCARAPRTGLLPHNRKLHVQRLNHRPAPRQAHRLSALAKKSRSTTSCSIFACSWSTPAALQAAAASGLPKKLAAIPSIACIFQTPIIVW